MSDGGILVVDDEALIAMDIEMTLEDAGFGSVTVCNSVVSALRAIEAARPALAVLDLNLGPGETSLPVAESLRAIGCPFLFLSGYTSTTVPLPDALADVPRLTKPFRGDDLVGAVHDLFERSKG